MSDMAEPEPGNPLYDYEHARALSLSVTSDFLLLANDISD